MATDAPETRRYQFSLRGLLLATAVVALIAGISSHYRSVPLAIALSLPPAGWLLWRLTAVSRGGMVLWLLAAEFLAAAWLLAVFDVEAILGCFCLAVFTGAVSALWFLYDAFTQDQPKRNIACAAGVALMLTAWFLVAVPRIVEPIIIANKRQLLEQWAAMDAAVAQVERVRLSLGRAPEDQAELEQLLGRPLPAIRIAGLGEQRVFYERVGEDRFLLRFREKTFVDCVYDSDEPQEGWRRRVR